MAGRCWPIAVTQVPKEFSRCAVAVVCAVAALRFGDSLSNLLQRTCYECRNWENARSHFLHRFQANEIDGRPSHHLAPCGFCRSQYARSNQWSEYKKQQRKDSECQYDKWFEQHGFIGWFCNRSINRTVGEIKPYSQSDIHYLAEHGSNIRYGIS